MKTYMPSTRSASELERIQLEGLQWTVRHAYNGSSHYRKKLDEAGVTPNSIKTLDDIRRLPFTSAQDLSEGYPFPLLSVPMQDVVRVHASSGTTGKRKVLCYTKNDIADWRTFFARCYEMAGLTAEDRVQICVGYGVWTAGVGFQMGCEEFGAMAVPAGPGNLEMQMEFLVDFQSTVICCTASMGLLLAEEVEKRNLGNRINLKRMIYGSERSSSAMRNRVKNLLNLEHMFDIPGMTELYGPGTGIECSAHDGMHYWADYYILEILDPETLQPVEPGEIGEMVVTTLRKEAVPLIRYRTRDLTALKIEPCACGSILPRHGRIMGRTDDMFIVKAVNIYPGQIDNILSRIEEIGSEYQVILRREEGRDKMILRIEKSLKSVNDQNGNIIQKIKHAIRSRLMVTPEIELMDYGQLPRSERKTRRVFDYREEQD